MENYAPLNCYALQSSTKLLTRSFLLRTKTLSKALIYAALISLASAPALQAQTCENIPNPGTESMSAKITYNGIEVTETTVVPLGATLRIDSVAEAYGSCTGMSWTSSNPPTCEANGFNYERVSQPYPGVGGNRYRHTTVQLDCWLYLRHRPKPTTAVINSESADTTGPVYQGTGWKGTYTFHIYANINTTPCNLNPNQTEEKIIVVHVGDNDGATDCGPPCEDHKEARYCI